MIHLGTRASTAKQVIESLERNLDQNPNHRQFLASLITAYWPGFSRLTDGARRAWIAATELVHNPLFHSRLDEEVWAAGGIESGKALELELEARILQPFALFVRDNEETLRVAIASMDHNKLGVFAKYLIGKGRQYITLGLVLDYLRRTLRPQSDLIFVFQKWLEATHPEFLRALAVIGDLELQQIGKLRNSGSHASISREQLIKLHASCQQLLTSIKV